MVKKKGSASKSKKGGLVKSAASKVASAVMGGKGGSGRKSRGKGPAYWANKVLVAKLKKKYWAIKYGGMK